MARRSLSDTEALVRKPLKGDAWPCPVTDLMGYGRANPNAGEAQSWRDPCREAGVGGESLRSAVMILGNRPK